MSTDIWNQYKACATEDYQLQDKYAVHMFHLDLKCTPVFKQTRLLWFGFHQQYIFMNGVE